MSSPTIGFAAYASTASLNSPRTMWRPTTCVIGRIDPKRCMPKKFGKPPRTASCAVVAARVASASSGGTAKSRTTMRKRFPSRSPISSRRSVAYVSRTSTSARRRDRTTASGASKQNSCVVTARLSFVPANEIRLRLTAKRRAISRTRRFVSQFRERIVAIVYFAPSTFCGGEDISSTTKSSASTLTRPPIPGVVVARPTTPIASSEPIAGRDAHRSLSGFAPNAGPPGSVEAAVRDGTAGHAGDADFPSHDEVEDAVCADSQAVHGQIPLLPQLPDVGAWARRERVLPQALQGRDHPPAVVRGQVVQLPLGGRGEEDLIPRQGE